jgi:hypothetical protein
MKPPSPRPVAFCWYKYWEMSKKSIDYWGCTDPKKQAYGKCEHLMFYGDKHEAMDSDAIQQVYESCMRILLSKGIRLEGRNMNLVQVLPGGARIQLPVDDAEKIRREKIQCNKCG